MQNEIDNASTRPVKIKYPSNLSSSSSSSSASASKPWWIVPHINCQEYILNTQGKLSLPKSVSRLLDLMDYEAGKQISFTAQDVYRNEFDETCSNYLDRRHFIQKSQSQEEANFPIAYNVLVFKDYPQVELLLRTIYRPEHCICIHIDVKADELFKKAMKNLIDCFPQDSLFIAPDPIEVVWGKFSVLEAEIICMRHLWNLMDKKKWKYFINLTGQELPLRTNLELVRILTIFNGTNSMEGTVKRMNLERIPQLKFPFPILWTKGSVHIVASAAFVDFALHSYKARKILYALRLTDVTSPVETFFTTLNHNPQFKTPGAYLLEPETDPVTYPFIARLKNWLSWPFEYPCKSENVVREICIWGLLDLPFITSRPELFVNKFHWTFQNIGTKCLQEWYWNRTRKEIETGNVHLDLTFYENLSFVKHHQ